MISDPMSMSFKERAEATIIGELVCNPILRDLLPKTQNQDSRPKHPYIAVVVTKGKEISPGAGIFFASGEVGFYFDTKKGQTGESLDMACRAAEDQLREALLRGDYGMAIDGEQPIQYISDTIRKRVISFRLIAS
jgi:hypothetical protein